MPHRADGKVKIEETADPGGKTWGQCGAIAGGLVGRRACFAGALVGEEFKAIGESQSQEGSAIIAIAEDHVAEHCSADSMALTDRPPRPQRR